MGPCDGCRSVGTSVGASSSGTGSLSLSLARPSPDSRRSPSFPTGRRIRCVSGQGPLDVEAGDVGGSHDPIPYFLYTKKMKIYY